MTEKGKNMDGLSIFGITVGAIIVIVIDYFVAKQFYKIAKEKGYEDTCYFWYSFLFSGVGYAMVIALPDHSNCTVKTVAPDELPEL